MSSSSIFDRVRFRQVRPTDIPVCAEIEKASYPPDEMASTSTLQYRQHHAARYFRCAVLPSTEDDDEDNNDTATTTTFDKSVDEDRYDDDHDTVIGFICSTRCHDFTSADAMVTHSHDGPLLAIHSVVVAPEYRRLGIASCMMKNYIDYIRNKQLEKSMQDNPVEKLVLLAKANLMAFYVNCGFQVIRPSPIVHGQEQWYELEIDLTSSLQPQQPPCYIVDAFADPTRNGTGNPASVVVLEKNWPHDAKFSSETKTNGSKEAENEEMIPAAAREWMQSVATEFNLSETAFVWPCETATEDDKDAHVQDIDQPAKTFVDYHIRYFTPIVEVPLCGHATLASASVLFQTTPILQKQIYAKANNNNNDVKIEIPSIRFHTSEVTLNANLDFYDDKQKRYTNIAMQFPAAPVQEITSNADQSIIQSMLSKALNINITDSILYMGVAPDLGDLIIEVTHDCFQQIPYNGILYDALIEWEGYRRGVILSCLEAKPEEQKDEQKAETQEADEKEKENEEDDDNNDNDEGFDFLSRFFAPKAGIDEDPVTGSAHCALSLYYSEKLNGKSKVVGYQKSRRGGIVHCELNESRTTVTLTGTSVNTVTGRLWW